MEKVQAGLRGAVKLSIFVFLVLLFLTTGACIHLLTRHEDLRRQRFMRSTHFYIRLALAAFGIHVRSKNLPSSHAGALLVGNHMGFLDILAVYSLTPSLFVTSEEMHETPGLGLITEMAGCIYVERRNRTKTVHEMQGLAQTLQNGFPIVLYPEATSTNGEQVLPFKRTLLMAASEAGVAIQPFVVNFTEINGDGFTLKWRDHVCWYGDMGFFPSLWKAFTLRSLSIQVEYLDKIYPRAEDDRKVIADFVHDQIAAKFKPVAP